MACATLIIVIIQSVASSASLSHGLHNLTPAPYLHPTHQPSVPYQHPEHLTPVPHLQPNYQTPNPKYNPGWYQHVVPEGRQPFQNIRHSRPLVPEYTVYRNPYDITGPRELKDAVRTQDEDIIDSLPYKSPLHGALSYIPHIPDRSNYIKQLTGDHPTSVAGTPFHISPQMTPYQYDVTAIPECALTNRYFYNISFCLQDLHYPVDTIKYELERNMPIVDRLLSDISYQSADNLVDGLTKYQEERYTYQHYYGSHNLQLYNEEYNGYSYDDNYAEGGGYVCPSDIFYGRPHRAVNTYGEWKVIVNLPDSYYMAGYGAGYEKYTQTTRLEQCVYPGAPCSYISAGYNSSCLQKHSFVRLLAYTFHQGLHIDSFKMPVACSCHISSPYRSPTHSLRPSLVHPSSPTPPNPTHLPPLMMYQSTTPVNKVPSANPYRVHVG